LPKQQKFPSSEFGMNINMDDAIATECLQQAVAAEKAAFDKVW